MIGLVRRPALSWQEKENLFGTMSSIIDMLDIFAIDELLQGTEKDISNIFDIILEETHSIINLESKEINSSELNYLPSLKKGYEHYLRCANLNYFISSCLPEFDQSWHCFGKGLEVRMFDSSIKKVEDIKVGDLVMGPDSTPREVLKLYRGKSPLYKVNSTGGVDSYIVNDKHDILLWDKKGNLHRKKAWEIPCRPTKYKHSSYWHEEYSQRIIGYNIGSHSFEIDPYYLGLWLGDGTLGSQEITTGDPEIVSYLKNLAEDLDLRFVDCNDGFLHYTLVKKEGTKRNALRDFLRKYGVFNHKKVPAESYLSSEEERLKLLAGFIDSDGTFSNNTFTCCGISEELIRGIQNLCFSLGFRASFKETNYFNSTVNRKHQLFSICISGDIYKIPTKIKRKISSLEDKKSKKNRDWRRSNIKSIESLGIGEYYGFELDGDHQFLAKNGMVLSNCIEWGQLIQLYKYLCVIASRDHSKSFTFSFANILWGLYRYEKPNQLYVPPLDIQLCKETMLITNEYSLAKRLLKKVKQEIESNPIFQERLLPEKGNSGWGETALVCRNGGEMTLSSFHSSNRGPHPGRIIVDDFLDKSALYSKTQREKFNEVFTAEIMNMILPQGQVCVVGTPFHERDLYNDLKQDPNWKVFEYPAIFPDGRILYDGRYNYDALCAKRKSLGSLIFSREILVKPISDNVSIFPWNILEISFINMQSLTLVQNRQSYPVKFKKVAVGCDFALSSTVGADYTVYTVVGLDSLDQIHLIHSCILHGAGYNQQIIELQRICNDFQPETVVMEVNGFQKVMAQNARERGIQNIIEFNTTGFLKKDLYEGVPALAVMFETGTIKLPRGNDDSKQITDMYCSQLNSMAFDDDKGKLESVSEHDDCVMSLFFAIKGLKTINSEFRVSMIES